MSNTYYALHSQTGQTITGLASMDEAMRRLAEIEGVDRSALVHEDRSSSAGSELRWDVYRAGSFAFGGAPDSSVPPVQIGTVGDEEILSPED